MITHLVRPLLVVTAAATELVRWLVATTTPDTVRGFNTKNGIGVLGQAGISGGTGTGGRFENVNAANGTDVPFLLATDRRWVARGQR